MFEICDMQDCTGCGACGNVCPQNCITMKLDKEGFLKYSIDEEKCINCGLCLKVCPSISYSDLVEKKEPEAYLCWNKDEKIRMDSSSGGIFSALANDIFKKNGIVFGAEFDDKFRVKHTFVENNEELISLRGSKYIQSDTGKTFAQAKEILEEGKLVLYSGTPCQVAGLYKFLGRNYDNLLTCDLICHGVSSTHVYRDTLNYYENKYNSKITSIRYRDKVTGWKNSSVSIVLENGKQISDIINLSLLTYGFAVGFTNNKTCGMCESGRDI